MQQTTQLLGSRICKNPNRSFENRRMSQLRMCFSLCLGLNIQSVLKRFVKLTPAAPRKNQTQITINTLLA